MTDCDHADMNIEKKIFEEAGLSFEHCKAVTEDEVIRSCPDGEIFLVQYAHITEKVMENIPSLKLIVRYGVGVDTVDLEAAARHGIQVCNVPDYGMNEVADQAAAMLLALKRKLTVMNRYTREEKWDYTKAIPIHRFSEQTVGIVGLGRIGRCFASRVHAVGFRILGYDPVYKEIPGLYPDDRFRNSARRVGCHLCPLPGRWEQESVCRRAVSPDEKRGGDYQCVTGRDYQREGFGSGAERGKDSGSRAGLSGKRTDGGGKPSASP